MSEKQERLDIISEVVSDALQKHGANLTVRTYNLLSDILSISAPEGFISEKKMILSCDASITKNPGGRAAVGVVIEDFTERHKAKPANLEVGQLTPSKTNNQAEYDAIYFGLTTLFGLHNNPGYPVEVRSDSQIVINQLKNTNNCNDKKLINKRDLIWQLAESLPVEIRWVWRPRNSTSAMKIANNIAQDLIGVKNH